MILTFCSIISLLHLHLCQITQTPTGGRRPLHPSPTQKIQTEDGFYDDSNYLSFSTELVPILHCQLLGNHQRTSRAHIRGGRNSRANGQSLCYLQPYCLYDYEWTVSTDTLGHCVWKWRACGTWLFKKQDGQSCTFKGRDLNEYVNKISQLTFQKKRTTSRGIPAFSKIFSWKKLRSFLRIRSPACGLRW